MTSLRLTDHSEIEHATDDPPIAHYFPNGAARALCGEYLGGKVEAINLDEWQRCAVCDDLRPKRRWRR